jgi:hypothetical protein
MPRVEAKSAAAPLACASIRIGSDSPADIANYRNVHIAPVFQVELFVLDAPERKGDEFEIRELQVHHVT